MFIVQERVEYVHMKGLGDKVLLLLMLVLMVMVIVMLMTVIHILMKVMNRATELANGKIMMMKEKR